MSKPALTDRQKSVLQFIIDQIQDTGYPPTIREIGDHLGIKSTNGVNDHLKALEKKGYLKRESSKSRALKPLCSTNGEALEESSSPGGQAHRENEGVPVVGRIAAGQPTEAVENIEQYVSIDESLLDTSGKTIFGLRVEGRSMIEDGIHDGDLIFVRQTNDVTDGEIVAAMVDGEATVKRLFREDDRIRLQPSHPEMSPIYIHAEDGRDTRVLGRVVGIYRDLP